MQKLIHKSPPIANILHIEQPPMINLHVTNIISINISVLIILISTFTIHMLPISIHISDAIS